MSFPGEGGPLVLRPQQKNWSCGAAAVRNMCILLGEDPGESRMRDACSTTEHGTDEHGLIKGLLAMGHYGYVYDTISERGMSQLRSHLMTRGPAFLCVDDHDHWVLALGVLSRGFVVFDPANGSTTMWDTRMMLRRWRYEGDGRPYFGVWVEL